jgi:hypothetical protein
VVDLMDALRKSIGAEPAKGSSPAKKPSKVASGNADADCRQETGQGGRGQTAAEVGVGYLCGGFTESSLRQAGCVEILPGPAALFACF